MPEWALPLLEWIGSATGTALLFVTLAAAVLVLFRRSTSCLERETVLRVAVQGLNKDIQKLEESVGVAEAINKSLTQLLADRHDPPHR